MKVNSWNRFLIVNEDLSAPASFFGNVILEEKSLKDVFRKHNKYQFNWDNLSLDKILEGYIEQTQGKHVIVIENATCPDQTGIYPGMTLQQAEKIYGDVKIKILTSSPTIVSLYELVKPYLRSTVIQHYFKHQILTTVTKEMLELCNSRDSVSHVQYSWSYIASFKKKLLGEYIGKELYWIRLIYNKASEKLIADNVGDTRRMAKTKDLKVFYPSPYNKRDGYGNAGFEYIDIFTTDSTIGHFFTLTADRTILAFAAELTPLVQNLQELELLNV